jgi:hypothetical protein
MHTVERLEAVLDAARARGYQVRMEWLGGSGGGACEVHGQRCLFVDLALDAAEQLAQVAAALAAEGVAVEEAGAAPVRQRKSA